MVLNRRSSTGEILEVEERGAVQRRGWRQKREAAKVIEEISNTAGTLEMKEKNSTKLKLEKKRNHTGENMKWM